MDTIVTDSIKTATPKPKRTISGLPERLCRLPSCREKFTPTWRNQEFHLPACREGFYHPLDVEDATAPARIKLILSKLDGSHPFFKAVQSAVQAKIGAKGNQSSKRKVKK